jgi:hypothetical protein
MNDETKQLTEFLQSPEGARILSEVRKQYPNFETNPLVIVSFALQRLPSQFDDAFLRRVNIDGMLTVLYGSKDAAQAERGRKGGRIGGRISRGGGRPRKPESEWSESYRKVAKYRKLKGGGGQSEK